MGNKYQLTHTHTAVLRPFFGTTRVGRYQKRHSPIHTWNMLWESVIILDFMRHGEDKRGKCADNPTRRHPIGTINDPHLCHPPNFLLDALFAATLPIYPVWDRHQICWIAYLEAWLNKYQLRDWECNSTSRFTGNVSQTVVYLATGSVACDREMGTSHTLLCAMWHPFTF